MHFGKQALDKLADVLRNYAPKVMLTYGGGSIKRNGIYDKVMKILKDAGKTVAEEGGVMSNPDIEKYADATLINTTRYYTVTRENEIEIFKKSL